MSLTIFARMHTAEHIFCKSLIKEIPNLKLEKIKLDENESSIFVLTENLTWKQIFKAEEKVNEIIKEEREVKEHFSDKNKVKEHFPGVRIKLERIKENQVRIIEVKDFDISACAGEHCNNTKEIQNFLVTHFKSAGSNKYEIKFKVDVMEDLFNFSKLVRESTHILGTDYEKLIPTLQNLKIKLEKYKNLARDVEIKVETEQINGIKFKHKVIEIEPKQLIKKANDLKEDKTLIILINKTEKLPQLVVIVSDDLDLNASEIVKDLCEKFNGKGGGGKDMAQGAIETNKFDEVFSYVKKYLE